MYKINSKEYWAIHYWVRKNKGRADKCVQCGKNNKETQIWWANISGKYYKDLNDYEALCCKCHRKKDYTDEWRENVSKATRGKKNPFYGKQHSQETKNILRKNGQKRVWERDERGHFKKLVSNK
jgi:hypothetical protein